MSDIQVQLKIHGRTYKLIPGIATRDFVFAMADDYREAAYRASDGARAALYDGDFEGGSKQAHDAKELYDCATQIEDVAERLDVQVREIEAEKAALEARTEPEDGE